MTKNLLLCLAAATLPATVCMAASDIIHPAVTDVRTVSARIPAKAISNRPLGKGVSHNVYNCDDVTIKRITDTAKPERIIGLARHRNSGVMRRVSGGGTGVALWESFEGWEGAEPGWEDFAYPWCPDGWELVSKTGREGKPGDGCWYPSQGMPAFNIVPTDGRYLMEIDLNKDTPQDEWLISPFFEVESDYMFTFDAYISPLYLFKLDDEHFDWSTWEWIGLPEVSATMQVLARQEGGEEWTTLWDASEQWMGFSMDELIDKEPKGLEPYEIDLQQYIGKTIQLAFRYVGLDGNVMFIDSVRIGLLGLDISYLEPAQTLYWSFDRSYDWNMLNFDVAMYPAYAPITWTRTPNDYDELVYSWEYTSPDTHERVLTDTEELTVTYKPDYTDENTIRNNWYQAPRLLGDAEGLAQSSFQASYSSFQAGGRPDYKLMGFLDLSFGLAPFNSTHGHGMLTVSGSDPEALPVPLMGYSSEHDNFWLNYASSGAPAEGDEAYVSSIYNVIYSPSSPLVLSGVHVLAQGIVHNPNFSLDIFALEPDGAILDKNLICSVICPPENIQRSKSGALEALNILFNFDEPVVITPNENNYVAVFSGFHDSENVEWFAPMQSIMPFSHSRGIGFFELTYSKGDGTSQDAILPVAYISTPYGAAHTAFSIILDGEYPWLEAETCDVSLPADGSGVSVALDSYYDSSELKVTASQGISASVTGRYNETVLSIAGNAPSGTVTLEGPGVSKTFNVSRSTALSSVGAASASEIIGSYDLTGRRVDVSSCVPGTYILRRADGTASKIHLR